MTSFILRRICSLCVFAILLASFLLADEKPADEKQSVRVVQYNRDVRPILADNCFACHGPDSASRKADLRLDKADVAEEFGAIVPGDLQTSELVRRIHLPETDDLAMPPNTGHKRLTTEQRQTLEAWIEQGAVYEPHWSFITPTRPEVPAVETRDWVRNPIDQFILAGLEGAGLMPAEEADRRTLARRLSLDLTGLPPEVAAVEAFVNDKSPEFYERYVDSLLESTRWGEHRGRYWLDYARFADTHGIHFDNYREMWSYRDWVINAFNRNMPFDEFTIEQLAGDLLPSASMDQQIASGFNRCNITTNEGGIIDEEYKVLYARDRTETTSAVWMALTTGCAVCHDHKFDPISTKEFYSLSAFFNNTTQAVRDGNIAQTPPIITVPRIEDRARFAELPVQIETAKETVIRARSDSKKQFDELAKSLDVRSLSGELATQTPLLHAMLAEAAGDAITSLKNGGLQLSIAAGPLAWQEGHTAPSSLLLGGDSFVAVGDVAGELEFDKPFSYGAWIYLNDNFAGGSILSRMDEDNKFCGFDIWLEGDNIGSHIIHSWPDNALKVVTQQPLPKNQWQHVFFAYDGSGNADGLQIYVNGNKRGDRNVSAEKLTATIRNDVAFKIGGRSKGSVPQNVRVNDVRVYDSRLSDEEISGIAESSRLGYLAQIPVAKRTDDQTNSLFDRWAKTSAPTYLAAIESQKQLESEDAAIRMRGTVAHVMNERAEPAEAFILERGEYDQQREKVTAGVPEVLPTMMPELPRNRLGLAKWLVAPEHPLTARVTVNRFWQELFGTALVASSGDFGITGELPSHPALLDWLAVDFRETGWDVKRLIRMYVTSATYRQAAITTGEKLERDPANRLLSRGPRFRMDAEMVRDYALSASGLLSGTIGGPSVRPYQPESVWETVAMPGSNTRDYKPDEGENLYRRSMYTFWKRSAPPASMDIFNAPSRETCTVRRERTNTPLQALVTLNDPQLIEAARHLASDAMRQSSEPGVRIDTMAKRLLSRSLTADETVIITQSLESLIGHYRDDVQAAEELIRVGETEPPGDMPVDELAAYTMLANQLLNLDEVISK